MDSKLLKVKQVFDNVKEMRDEINNRGIGTGNDSETQKSSPDNFRDSEHTVDMIYSIILARTLIEDEIDTLSFPMIDKLQIWDVKLTRGQEKRMKLPAGTFDCVEIIIQPTPRPGENVDDKKKKKFRGLFGMRGNIHLWVDRKSGVPVRIQGDIPAGIVTLGVDVKLKSHAGTPSSFKAVGRP